MSTVQHLREYTAQEMKPEMGQWAEEYTVKMKDIQTKLRFKKHYNNTDKPFVSNYNELFESHPYQLPLQEDELSEQEKLLQAYNRKIPPQGSAGRKILVTGEEGTGKTVFCKKIAWDWAKGTYVQFSVVFYICSKLARST